ncbi:MAG: dipeptidase PepE [Schleiferiaceae bacterium]|nr:dipeptidase PepE [Schleiferiaceae bacterium]MDR9442073.1 dipeptidase PepE [Schleiferiaceae bacterium]
MSQPNLLLVSTSKVHDTDYMEYLLPQVKRFFRGSREVLFLPYARPGGISYEEYTELPRKAFAKIGLKVKGTHEHPDPVKAVGRAEAIFTGGGNTFLLLKTLCEKGVLQPLQKAVAQGTRYMGSSAGSNIAGPSIGTSNDMPIVYPPRFEGLGWVPFNINPHYLDPDPDSTHQGETRERRINEFHVHNTQPVIGLREGSWLRVEGRKLKLKGPHPAPLFRRDQEPVELEPGDISFLLRENS